MRIVAAIVAFIIASALPAFAGSPQTTMLDVQNMTCPLCPITVKKSLVAAPGVADVKIDLDKNRDGEVRSGQGRHPCADQDHYQRGLPGYRTEMSPR